MLPTVGFIGLGADVTAHAALPAEGRLHGARFRSESAGRRLGGRLPAVLDLPRLQAALAQALAQDLPGAQFSALPGFGHFPMVENPDGVLPHLLDPLDARWQHLQETNR